MASAVPCPIINAFITDQETLFHTGMPFLMYDTTYCIKCILLEFSVEQSIYPSSCNVPFCVLFLMLHVCGIN